MLIASAEVYGQGASGRAVRIEDGVIAAVGNLEARPGEAVIDARGGALLPGLHDHHIHLLSYAASLGSIDCGPPAVNDAAELLAALHRADATTGAWLRGIGYHESVAGDIDRQWLDRHGPARPMRLQHRSGRLWIINTPGLETLRAAGGPTPEDGRLFHLDAELRAALGTVLPPVAQASAQLARWGVTGLTDMTPGNDAATFALFTRLAAAGDILQRVRMAGSGGLDELWQAQRADSADGRGHGIVCGETKFHLHETDLPELDGFCDAIRHSHDLGRAVAVHCVTETELVFTLAALEAAGPLPGDRIEHASITPPTLLAPLRDLGLTVVTQPNFVAERGAVYRREIAAGEHPWLYRCRSFEQAGIALAGGTDAPFGHPDPWRALHAAVQRRTTDGALLGGAEALTPEAALALFLGAPHAPARIRRIEPGATADLCLLAVPWRQARCDPSARHVRATIVGGTIVHDADQADAAAAWSIRQRVDQPPGQR